MCECAFSFQLAFSFSILSICIFTIIPNGVVGMFISNLIWWMKWNRGFCLKTQMENFWTVAIFQEYEAIKLKLWLLNGNERWFVKMLPRFHLWPLLNFAKCHTRKEWLLCQFSVWYIILWNISIWRMCNCVLKLKAKMCYTESNSLFNDRNVCFRNVVCTFVDKHIHINTRLQIISLKFFKHQKTFKFLVNLSCVFFFISTTSK